MAVERHGTVASAGEEDSSVIVVPVLSSEWKEIPDIGFLTFEQTKQNK